MPVDFGMRGVARLWYAKTLADAGSVPYARDAPTSRSGEGAADHVLLIGNGPAHGWGVVSHQLALCGQLAEAITAATGRSTDVDYVGAELMNAESALAWLGDHDVTGYDAVVVVMGLNDAARLTPVDTWEQHMLALLQHLRAGLRHDAPIAVSGVQPLSSVPQMNGPVTVVGQRRADAMNDATRRFVGTVSNTTFVPLGPSPIEPGRPYGSARSYRARADELAAAVGPLLDEHREQGIERRRSKVDAQQWTWLGAPALLDAAAERGTPELQRLVNAAKIEFDVTLAVVTFHEGDRMWFGAASADTPVAIPVSLSYDLHVPADAPLVVPDAGADPRFVDNPFIAQSNMPFYAGYPLLDRSGRMIGTFCVLSARPQPADSVPLEALRAYAGQAEQELHRLEAEAFDAVSV